ncbi:type II toxin-antitoxin system RelE/ParE family toxin [Azonexus sp.]|uniref:type II toxin-antitoxin system RelE/ParE family toxin n=1 Tax=Azonexus sp. TaxID=1872668 RepID=UPI0035B413BC
MLPLVWSEEARGDLLEIVSYVAERDPRAAMSLGHAIEQGVWPLSEHPFLFKASERIAGCREIVIHPNYVLVYRVTLECIEILRVMHTRRQFPFDSGSRKHQQ